MSSPPYKIGEERGKSNERKQTKGKIKQWKKKHKVRRDSGRLLEKTESWRKKQEIEAKDEIKNET